MQLVPSTAKDRSKSGILLPGDFSLVGGRQKATVTLSPAFADTDYVVTFGVETNTHSFLPTYESKTASSFVVNLNTASLAGLGAVTWFAKLV